MEIFNEQSLVTATAIFIVAVISIFTTITAILNYHWKTYAIDKKELRKIRLIYFSGALVLFFIMAWAFILTR